MFSVREDRMRKAMAYARQQARKLREQGLMRYWGLAIHKAAEAFRGEEDFYTFQHELALRFKANYRAKVERNQRLEEHKGEQLSLSL
jgi:hypothetical protein